MKRHVAALALIVFLASATPSAEPATEAASLASVPTLRGVPHVREGLHPGDGTQNGLSSEGSNLLPLMTGGTPSDASSRGAPVPPRTADEPIVAPSGEPTGEVGTALYSATATWCAPIRTQCQSWGPPARLGAVFGFRWGDAPWWARVWRDQAFVDVLVVSFCQCGGTHNAIDLSPAAFSELADLSRGRIDVAVEVLTWPGDSEDPPPHPADDAMRREDGPRVTAPPTDVTP